MKIPKWKCFRSILPLTIAPTTFGDILDLHRYTRYSTGNEHYGGHNSLTLVSCPSMYHTDVPTALIGGIIGGVVFIIFIMIVAVYLIR